MSIGETVREIAGFPLKIFYKGRFHGATDFFYFHPIKTCEFPAIPFFPHFYISRDEERLHNLTEKAVEINVFPSASPHLLQFLD